MTFKAMAAVLALLPVFAGAIHSHTGHANPPAVAAESEHLHSLRIADTAPARANVQNAMLFSGVIAARRAGRAARGAHVPEPKVLLWLGVGLLLVNLWRGRQARKR